MDGAMCTRWWRVALVAGLLGGLIEPSSSRGDLPDPDPYPSKVHPSWVQDEMAALLAIKAELQDPDNVLHSWFIHADDPCPCQWEGVACNEDTHVSQLDLTNNRFSGTLSPRIGDLTSLQVLVLWGNSISGPIPDSIGRLKMLSLLDMSNNSLNGSIPSSLGDLRSLNYLALQDNSISGHIPHSIGRLGELHDLCMSNNMLTGTIPSSLGDLKNLKRLALQDNFISGPIPDSIGRLVMLDTLYMSNNRINETIPSSLGDLKNLKFLKLQGNSLSGPIPDSIGRLKMLLELDMSNNSLNGSIPSSLGDLKNLYFLKLNNNSLSGVVPDSLGTIYSLDILDLSFNNLSGQVPDFDLCCSNSIVTGNTTFCVVNVKSVEDYCSRDQKIRPHHGMAKLQRVGVIFAAAVGSILLGTGVGMLLWWRYMRPQKILPVAIAT